MDAVSSVLKAGTTVPQWEQKMDEIRERQICRIVAATMTVRVITFGFIQLMGWIRV
jgi:hypothetical protein